jgi:hypothetical protein
MSFAPRRSRLRKCTRLPVLFDSLHDLTRSRAVTLSAQLQAILSLALPLAFGLPTCADVVGFPLSGTFAISLAALQAVGVLFSLIASSQYNSPLWLLAAVPLVATELSFLVAKDTLYCVDPSLRADGFAGNAAVSADSAALRAFSYAAPLSVIVFVRSLLALLVAIQLLALIVLLVAYVIMPLRSALSERSDAWERVRHVTRPSRWGVLLPDELARAHDDEASLWASDEVDAAAEAEARFGSFLAEQEVRGGGGAGGGGAVAGFANEDITTADFIARSKMGDRALRRRTRKARFGDTRNGVVRRCARAVDAARGASDVLPSRLALAVLCALTALVVATLWALGPLVSALDAALGWVRDVKGAVWAAAAAAPADALLVSLGYQLDEAVRGLGTFAPDALRLGVCIAAALVAANVLSALPRFVADHVLLVTLRARRGAAAADVATLLGGALGRSLLSAAAADAAAADVAPSGFSGRFGGGRAAHGIDGASDDSSSLNQADGGAAGGALGLRRLEAAALRLAAYRLGLDLLPQRAGVAPLHGLPLAPAFEHALALDFVPSLVASALLSWALLSALISALAFAAFVAPVELVAAAAAVAAALAARSVSYRVLEGACFRRQAAAPARPRCARVWMLADALATVSPLAWAQGAAGAVARLVLSSLLSALHISSLDRSAFPTPFFDSPFASHAALLRTAFLDGPPPGYDSVGARSRRDAAAADDDNDDDDDNDGSSFLPSRRDNNEHKEALLREWHDGGAHESGSGGARGEVREGAGADGNAAPPEEDADWADPADRRDAPDGPAFAVSVGALPTRAFPAVAQKTAPAASAAAPSLLARSFSAVGAVVSSAAAPRSGAAAAANEDRVRFGLGRAGREVAPAAPAPAPAAGLAFTRPATAPAPAQEEAGAPAAAQREVSTRELVRRESADLSAEREAELARELGL